jgi:tRNA pseudouridine55 synthase
MKSKMSERPLADGVLIVDKPSGWTSHDVVAKIRNITKIKKVGHTGTLDPFATGVLALTLGRATRLTNYFLASDKTYRGAIRFGFATTTFDLEGAAVGAVTEIDLDLIKLGEIMTRYSGVMQQTIPPYSAKKIQGRPMYDYARKGVTLDPATKEVTIKSLKLLSVDKDVAEFELACSAGTYARSLAHDIGIQYGCGAHLIRLCRIKSGEFPISIAVPMREEEQFYSREYFLNHAIPLRNLLCELPAIVVSSGDKQQLLHGMDLNLLTSAPQAEEFRLMDEEGELIAVGRRVQAFTSPVAQPAHWVRVHPRIIFG